MSELNTKQKILNASIQLFNEQGMANVRLQQIAHEIGISPGNLAYHFRNKEAIVTAINEELYREANDILFTYRVYPNLIDFDYQLNKYFAFTRKHPFYFLDMVDIERQYPGIKLKRRTHVSKMISQVRKRFDFNQQRGIIGAEPQKDSYDHTANTIWMLIAFWMPQRLVHGATDEGDICQFKQMIWNQLYPHFTEDGISEFEQLILPLLKPQSTDK